MPPISRIAEYVRDGRITRRRCTVAAYLVHELT